MGVWVTVVLIGAIALPSLARKKKMQPVGQQQQTVGWIRFLQTIVSDMNTS